MEHNPITVNELIALLEMLPNEDRDLPVGCSIDPLTWTPIYGLRGYSDPDLPRYVLLHAEDPNPMMGSNHGMGI